MLITKYKNGDLIQNGNYGQIIWEGKAKIVSPPIGIIIKDKNHIYVQELQKGIAWIFKEEKEIDLYIDKYNPFYNNQDYDYIVLFNVFDLIFSRNLKMKNEFR